MFNNKCQQKHNKNDLYDEECAEQDDVLERWSATMYRYRAELVAMRLT